MGCCTYHDKANPTAPEPRMMPNFNAKAKLPERGLPNLGNTCFANAILVCLWVTPGFRQLLDRRNSDFATYFSDLFLNPRKSVEGILHLLHAFDDGRQHCAHSLYTNIISKFVVKPSSKPISVKDRSNEELTAGFQGAKGLEEFEVFGSVWQTQFTCKYCNAIWKTGSCGYSLSLPVPQTFSRLYPGAYRAFDSGFFCRGALDCTEGNDYLKYIQTDAANDSQWRQSSEPLSVSLCFEYLQRVTLMTAENTLDCADCHHSTQHYKHTILIHCPQVLVIHFQRYSEATGQKLDSMITYSEKLDLAKVVQQGDMKDGKDYSLYAVVHHAGSLTSGHYWANIRHDGEWYRYDDISKSNTTWDKVLASTAYVLFYSKN